MDTWMMVLMRQAKNKQRRKKTMSAYDILAEEIQELKWENARLRAELAKARKEADETLKIMMESSSLASKRTLEAALAGAYDREKE